MLSREWGNGKEAGNCQISFWVACLGLWCLLMTKTGETGPGIHKYILESVVEGTTCSHMLICNWVGEPSTTVQTL